MSKKHKIIIIILFSCISLYLSLVNLGVKYEYTGSDAGAIYIFPVRAFFQSIYSWYEMCYGGTDGTINIPRLFPFLTIVVILKTIGLSTFILQRLLFFLYTFVPAISMFLLLSYLIKAEFRGKTAVLFLGSLFYSTNHFTMIILSHPVGLGELFTFYLVLPLLFLFFTKGLNEKQPLRNAIYFSLLSMCAIAGNMAYTGLIIFLFFFYFLWNMIFQKPTRAKFRFAYYTLLFTFLFNAWFILPFGRFIINSGELLQQRFWLGDIKYLKLLNTRNILSNVIAICGEVWANKQDIASLKPLHDNLLFIITKYIVPIIGFSAIFWIRKKKEIGFFVLLVLIMIFLAKGINKPFGNIFAWLYRYIPGFSIYRNCYDKFSMPIAFSYAILMTIALSSLFTITYNRLIRYTLYLICFISIIMSGGLLWQGKVVRWPNFFVKVPNNYYRLQKFVNSQKDDSRILTLSMAPARMRWYRWGYMGVDFFEHLLNKSLISYYDLAQKFGGASWILKTHCFPAIAKLFNIEYILMDESQIEFCEDESGLRNINAMKLYKTFLEKKISYLIENVNKYNGLNLYKIKTDFCQPHIYSSITPVCLFGNADIKESIYCEKYLGSNPFIILSKQNKLLLKSPEIIKDAELIILVNKNLPKEVLKKPIGKLMYLFSDVFFPKKRKTEYINKRKFYIKESGMYNCRVKLTPIYSTKPGLSHQILDFLSLHNQTELLKKNNCEGEYIVDNLGRLIASTYFDGNSQEDEYIQIRISDLHIDIKKYPWVTLEYKVEDEEIQIVEMVVGVDTDNDNKIDEHIRGLFSRASTLDYRKCYYNIYQHILGRHPDFKSAFIKEIELYPHKYWGIDCSTKERNKYYRFWIKNIGFCNDLTPNILKLEKIGFEPRTCVQVRGSQTKFTQELKGIDISKYPFMEFGYKNINSDKELLDLYFIFVNNETNEKNYIILKSIPLCNGELCRETIDISKLMNKNGLDLNLWLLRKARFVFYGNTSTLKKLKFYNTIYTRSKGFEIDKDILKIDNQKIHINRTLKNVKSIKNGFETEKILYLKKGVHILNNLIKDWDSFKLEQVLVEPYVKGPLISQNELSPKISYKKVNPTKYIVNITTKKPFWLILSESFNNFWVADAYISREKKQNIRIKKHLKVNNYSNGWYISYKELLLLSKGKKKKEYNFNIIINYTPQKLFQICILVSIVSVIIGIIILCINKKYETHQN